jgi:hypothetical protein
MQRLSEKAKAFGPLCVLLCGPVAPPQGGVSVHMQRLARALERRGYSVRFCDEARTRKPGIFNIRSVRLVAYIQLVSSAHVIHVNSSVLLFLGVHLLAAALLGKRCVVTVHSFRGSRQARISWRMLLRIFRPQRVYVSETISEDVGLPGVVMPAYIAADLAEEAELPEPVTEWAEEQKSKGRCLIVSNAYKLVEHEGQDLYGLDLCISAMASCPSAAMIFVVSNVDDGSRLAAGRRRVEAAGISHRFLLHTGGISFPRLLSIADASVRATNTDGDALSVRESLELCPFTIASDCVARPVGTILFETRSSSSLADRLSQVVPRAMEERKQHVANDCVEVLNRLYCSQTA